MTEKAILYARVSGEEQVRGYSLRQQLAALREWSAREGYEVLAEVEDPGHSGAYLERPGLDRVRDLVAEIPGRVAVVVAQDADRITRDPIHRGFLDDELQRHGCRLVALDDWGDDSHEGRLLKYMKGWVSQGERLKIAERTRRGLDRKVAEGKVIRGNQAPYGFRYAEDGETLLVSEPEMGVVRRIFREVGAEGESMGEVRRRLRGGGVPSAMGGGWPRSTIRYLTLCSEPDRVLAAYEEHLERRRRALRTGSGGAEGERALRERLRKLDARRAGYLDLAADGDITREDLRGRLGEIDGQREGARQALEEARSRVETVERLRSERELVYGRFAAMRGVDLRHLEAEDRRRVMQALRISAEVDRNSDVRITGVFGADITELLPMSQAPADEPYVVRFKYEIPPPTPPHKGVVTLDSASRCTL